jgi:cell division protein FtsB
MRKLLKRGSHVETCTPSELRWALDNAHAERDELDRRRDALTAEIYTLNDRLWQLEHPGEPSPDFEEKVPF